MENTQFTPGYNSIMTETKLSFIARMVNSHSKPQKQTEILIDSAISHGRDFALAISHLNGIKHHDRAALISANTALSQFGIILSQFSDYIIATDNLGASSTGFII